MLSCNIKYNNSGFFLVIGDVILRASLCGNVYILGTDETEAARIAEQLAKECMKHFPCLVINHGKHIRLIFEEKYLDQLPRNIEDGVRTMKRGYVGTKTITFNREELEVVEYPDLHECIIRFNINKNLGLNELLLDRFIVDFDEDLNYEVYCGEYLYLKFSTWEEGVIDAMMDYIEDNSLELVL